MKSSDFAISLACSSGDKYLDALPSSCDMRMRLLERNVERRSFALLQSAARFAFNCALKSDSASDSVDSAADDADLLLDGLDEP